HAKHILSRHFPIAPDFQSGWWQLNPILTRILAGLLEKVSAVFPCVLRLNLPAESRSASHFHCLPVPRCSECLPLKVTQLAALERCPSGRRSAPGERVYGFRIVGSNPTLSASSCGPLGKCFTA